MKRIFAILLCAAVFAACSDDNDAVSGKKEVTASFETSEGLLDRAGKAVTLGETEVASGAAVVKHEKVFWAKNFAEKGVFDGILFTSADKSLRVGSYFSNYADESEFGYDAWGGFAVTANYTQTPVPSRDLSRQFAAWTVAGANGSANCLIGYDGSYTDGPVFALPTIRFAKVVDVKSVYLANTVNTYSYAPENVAAADYYYKVEIIGQLAGVETARKEIKLADGQTRIGDWTLVDLSSLGKVDCLQFKPATNDVNEYGPAAPTYFALDDLSYTINK